MLKLKTVGWTLSIVEKTHTYTDTHTYTHTHTHTHTHIKIHVGHIYWRVKNKGNYFIMNPLK